MIKIENEKLANYLMFKLDKLDNEFTEEELQSIEEIVIDAVDLSGDYSEINLDVLNYFVGTKRLILRNLYFSKIDMLNISKLKILESVYMEKCEFENADMILNLQISEIELINCNIVDYSFLYKMIELNSLSVINGNISLKEINNLSKLKYLQLSYSNISNIVPLRLPLLEEIHIDNTNIEDISIIENTKNLKKLGISEKQYNSNKEFVEDLIENNVIVMNENIVEFNIGGNSDE